MNFPVPWSCTAPQPVRFVNTNLESICYYVYHGNKSEQAKTARKSGLAVIEVVSFFFEQERERRLGRDARIAVDGAEKSHQSCTMAQASNADETETVRPALSLPFRDRTHRQLWMEKKATTIRTRADPQGPASQAELAFHGVEYVVSVSSFNGDMLSIEVEQKQEGLRWRGDFTSRYIEDITTKTGNFKKFGVFHKMLVAAVVEESESVFIDLLTYADLEALKNKRQVGAAPARTTSAKQNNKRYLILTYAAEYDRVHYPLPLLFEDQPSVESLNATVARLKRENARLAATAGVGKGDSSEIGAENARLRDENEQLRQKVRQLRRDLSKAEKSATAGGVGAVELSAVRGSTDGAFASSASGEQVDHLQAELKAVNKELRVVRRERDDLSRQLQQKETELANVEASKKRMLRSKQRELDQAVEDAGRRRETERELRIKVKDLTTQCDGLERRLRSGGYGGSFASGSRSTSRAASPARTLGSGTPRASYGLRSGAASPARSGTPSRDYARPWTPGGVARARSQSPAPSHGFRTPTRARSPSPGPDARGRSPGPARSGAASPRFDPTAYVREKRERDAARFRNSARGIAQGLASPNRMRPSGTAGGGGYYTPGGGNSRGASPARRGLGSGAASPAPVHRARKNAERTSAVASSPGRILRDVKNKLADIAGKENADARPAKAEVKPPMAKHGDASAEIADIDTRLAALQSFLKEAKATATA